MSRVLKAVVLTLIVAGLFGGAVVSRAQNREKFVISAKAGGVNSVIGRVTVQHRGRPHFELLTAQSDLAPGDLVDTGTSGRAEVLLNPGSYLRVAEGTRFELTDNSLERLTVKLQTGTAIIEATGADNVNMEIGIRTPQGRIALVKRGIYRLNVAGGQTELLVLKGKGIVNGNAEQPVRGGQKAVITSASTVTAKLDKKDQDDFDLWSKTRAETLARANSRISPRALNGFFNHDMDWPLVSYSGGGGVWVYNSRALCFTFVPFYYGWGSPYGHRYSTGLWPTDPWGRYGYNRYPVIVTNPPGGNNGGAGGPTGSSPGSSGSGLGSLPGRGPIGPGPTGPSNSDFSGPRGKNIEPSDPNRP